MPKTIRTLATRLLILPLCLLGALVGLALLPLWPVPGFVLLLVGLGALYLLSLAPVADRLLRPLEAVHPDIDPGLLEHPPAYIVVLGGGFNRRDREPAAGRLAASTLARLTAALALARRWPNSKLLLCNYPEHPIPGNRDALYRAALDAGLASTRLESISARLSTQGELSAIVERVDQATVALVTTASHMPRALRRAQQLRMNCRAAPTQFLANPSGAPFLLRWAPGSHELMKSELALYEYLAMLLIRGD